MFLMVAGGHFGGEGKGNIVSSLVSNFNVSAVIKTGGPNSGHTYYDSLSQCMRRLRSLSAGSSEFQGNIIFPAGSLIDPQSLLAEIKETNTKAKIIIDSRAGILTREHVYAQENDRKRYGQIGCTFSGTGAASADRCWRRLKLAATVPALKSYCVDNTQEIILNIHEQDGLLVIEGAQAYGLSNYFGEYPYVTSRDSSVPGIWSQLGLSTKYLGVTALVLKSFPTRNTSESNSPYLFGENILSSLNTNTICEYGGGNIFGGDRRRRVGMFDWDYLDKVVKYMCPETLVVTGLDYLQSLLISPTIRKHYGNSVHEFISHIEGRYNIPVGIRSFGPQAQNVNITREFIKMIGERYARL